MVLVRFGCVAHSVGERGCCSKVTKVVRAEECVWCVRDLRLRRERPAGLECTEKVAGALGAQLLDTCLLYTSDAADE